MQLTFERNGMLSKLIGEVDKGSLVELEYLFQSVSPMDLTAKKTFFKDRKCWHGVTPFIKEHLESKGYEFAPEPDTASLLGDLGYSFQGKFREGQEEAIDAILEHKVGIIKASPGFGKTIVAVGLACKAQVPTLIVCDSKKTFSQMIDAFAQFSNINPGILESASKLKLGVVTIAKIGTLVNELKRNPAGKVAKFLHDEVKLIITDEVHHAAASQYRVLHKNLKSVEFICGLSATPTRHDGNYRIVYACYGPVCVDYSYDELIENDILCPVTVFTFDIEYDEEVEDELLVDVEKQKKNNSNYNDEYTQIRDKFLINYDSRNEKIAKCVDICRKKNKTCAIIVNRIEHIEVLLKLIPNSYALHGQMKEDDKEKIFKSLSSHKIDCVITTLLDEAVNIPSLDAVIYASGGKSTVKAVQRIRSTRTFSGTLHDGREYTKIRGYIFFPIDNAPILKKHSRATLTTIKEYIKDSEKNNIKDINENLK